MCSQKKYQSSLNFSISEKIPHSVKAVNTRKNLNLIYLIFLFLLFFHCLLWTKNSYAHPTSFEGGFAFMSEMSPINQKILMIYSPKYWLGVGAVAIRDPEQYHLATSQIGWLVKRWNFPEAQGNSYLLGGIGHGLLKQNRESEITGNMYRLGMQLDYETRRIYTFIRYVEHRFFKNNKKISDQLILAGGLAPYLGEFDELNSFVILKMTADDFFDKITLILMLRFFYKNLLWEIGQDINGKPQFNFMARF